MAKFLAWLKSVNWKQLFTGLKVLLATIGPTLLALAPTLGYQTTEVEKALATATTIIGLVLTLMERTQANMVLDAKDIKGVQVHVDTSRDLTGKPLAAPASVVAIAESPVPDVFPMEGGPREPTDN